MSSLTVLRFLSFAEGVSFLVLLYFAIYHKRILGDEGAIRVPGMVHGVLFVAFCMVLVWVWVDRKWSFRKVTFAFICSLVPLAPFYLEHRLRNEEKGV